MTPSEALPLFVAACADKRIAPGSFHLVILNTDDEEFCPLGALGQTEPERDDVAEGLLTRAARKLGVDRRRALAVALGFDGEPPSDSFDAEWFALGRDLRREWDAGRLGRRS